MAEARTPFEPNPPSRYRLIEKLGAGGNGVVYKAEDTRLARFVALKFLPPETQRDSNAQARFHREAQAASALNHRNICVVYDIIEHEGQTFIAMELLQGQTLREKIAARPLPLDTLLDYALQISAALEAAHKSGIVHRDIKPSNIFVTTSGEIKLTDFGLAKRVMLDDARAIEAPTISAPITARGSIVGTVAYMSPEQAQDKDIDQRSDIFSLGIVLYEMATCKRAFPADSSVAVIAEILHRDPVPIQQINPQIPDEFQRIVSKALEKDREDRYQTAHDLIVDLRRLLRKETERSQSATIPPPQQPKPSSARWLLFSFAAIALVAAAILFAFSAGHENSNPPPLPLHQVSFSNEDKSVPLMTDGTRLYFKSQDHTLQMSVKGGSASPIEAQIGFMDVVDVSSDGSEFLLRNRTEIQDESSRGTLWRAPILGGLPKRLGNLVGRGAAFSPDGKSIAIAEGKSLYLADGNGEHSKEIWSPGFSVGGWPHYSPDSSTISVTADFSVTHSLNRIWQVNANGGNPHPVLHEWPEKASTWNGVWTPNGQHFVFLSDRDGATAIYELLQPRWFEFWKKQRTIKLSPDQPEIEDIIPARDSNGLFFVGHISQGVMKYYDEKEKRFLPFLDGLPALHLVISPDRQWMVYSDFPRHFLWRSRLDGSEKLQLTDSKADMPTWSPDSQYIVYSNWSQLFRVGVNGSAPEQLTFEDASEVAPSFSPDGKSVYFNDFPDSDAKKRIRILDLQTRKISVMPDSQGYYVGSWSPDGQYLVAVHNAHPPVGLALYSVKTGKWTQLKTFERDWSYFVWAPDSKSVYVGRPSSMIDKGEIPGIYRLTIPDGKWQLFAKFAGIKTSSDGALNWVAITPDGYVAMMEDTSFSQIYELTWPTSK